MKNLRNRIYLLLRKSEGFFKTDMVYLARGGFWLNSSQIVASFISFLLSIAFANFLSPESFGTYKYILSLVGMIGVISLSGLSVSVTRSVAQGKEGVLKESFWLSMKWGILIPLLSLLISIYYFLNGNNIIGIGVLIAGTLSPLIDSGELYAAFLNGKKLFKTVGIYRILRTLFVSIGLFIGMLMSKNPIVIVSVYSLLHASSALFIYFLTIRKWHPNEIKDVESKKLGKHSSFLNGFAVLSDRIDNILLFHYLGPISLAVYNFALVIPTHLGGLIKNVNTLAIPKFSQGNKEEIQKTLFKKSFKVFLIGLIFTIVYVLIAPFVFETFFPQYLASLFFTKIYSLALLFSAALPLAFLDSQVAIREKYMISFFSNITKIILQFIGVYFYGILGLIIARLVSKIFGVSLAFYFAKKI